MSKFCTKCGNELKEGAEFCTSCGNKVNGTVKTYKETKSFTVMGVCMIVLSLIVMCGATADGISDKLDVNVVFIIPALVAIGGGILSIMSKKNKSFLIYSGALYILAAAINTYGIKDVSIFGIVNIIFAIYNIIKGTKKDEVR